MSINQWKFNISVSLAQLVFLLIVIDIKRVSALQLKEIFLTISHLIENQSIILIKNAICLIYPYSNQSKLVEYYR